MPDKTILIKYTSQDAPDKTREFLDLFTRALKELDAERGVHIAGVEDIGIYNEGLAVRILPDGIAYRNVQEGDIRRIIELTIKKGQPIKELLAKPGATETRVALRNCGSIDPDSIEDYIAAGGYAVLKRALFELKPEDIIAEVMKAGLRGRGGGGFPTASKWQLARKAQGARKFIICNADEGDPGAYMDRSILEGDPHSVLEGMIIAGLAFRASQGIFYVRAEYPLAVERVEKAIAAAREYGLLGERILGSAFNFDVDIRLGAGAFVCGEETALLASVEGRRGYPRPRPPYPTDHGLWGYPTVINNVETLANVPPIVAKGGGWFASMGSGKSTGTKVFALTGKVRNSGLVEVEMGVPIRDIVYSLGGGTLSGKAVKAVQTGGPSGGVIPKEHLDTPITYENLAQLGSIMGSGGMIVLDEDDCVVDICKFYLKFCVDESCGKCAPCRIGGFQMLEILERISEGKGVPEDLAKLHEIATAMQKASLCGLGQSAPNPVLSTLRYFQDEYKEHIVNKRCLTGKCKGLLVYSINQEKCKRCKMCQNNCPAGAIPGDREKGFVIDAAKCIKCGRCAEVCKFGAVDRR